MSRKNRPPYQRWCVAGVASHPAWAALGSPAAEAWKAGLADASPKSAIRNQRSAIPLLNLFGSGFAKLGNSKIREWDLATDCRGLPRMNFVLCRFCRIRIHPCASVATAAMDNGWRDSSRILRLLLHLWLASHQPLHQRTNRPLGDTTHAMTDPWETRPTYSAPCPALWSPVQLSARKSGIAKIPI